MNDDIERDLGEQPLLKIMNDQGLKSHDLVVASENVINHKMVSRAAKGRRLTQRMKYKILYALNKATGKLFMMNEVFNY